MQPKSLVALVIRHKLLVAVASVLALSGLGLGRSFMASPLPPPAPWSGDLPVASPPPSMEIYRLPTGTYQTPAALAFRGGSFSDLRDFAATAILVRHPKGDLLFDAGFGADVDTQIRETLPWMLRATSEHKLGEPVHAQLDAIGYDFDALQGVVITHAHWDHVSGLADLNVPVWMNAAQQEYAKEDTVDTRLFNSFSHLTIQGYTFDGPPYLGFPSSYDVWGDGSIVLVPAPGHTPGSIVAFVTLPKGERFALIGDLTWQLDGIELLAERPWLLRLLADYDPSQARKNLLQMVALDGLVQIVPAHDGRAFVDIPLLR